MAHKINLLLFYSRDFYCFYLYSLKPHPINLLRNLQYGIKNDAAEKIANDAKIKYISNRCIKQDYQNIFQKVNPVFPALKN